MQRRIGLAQALINDPDLVILDEPTAGLDPLGCREVKDLILALARRGKTVILSSHLLSDVEDVCDRVVIYYGGKIQAMGTLKDLLSTPDALRITTPILPRATIEKVLEVIRKDVAEDKVRIDTPTQNLESYFLNVVNKAREEEAATSGATSGNRVAEYLRAGGESGPTQQAKVLDRLTRSDDVTTSAPTPMVQVTNVESLSNKKLEQLTRHEEAAEPAPEQSPEKPRQADLGKANEKLSSLLNKPK
jgi:ABC-2 type transport system ATP-binding protein